MHEATEDDDQAAWKAEQRRLENMFEELSATEDLPRDNNDDSANNDATAALQQPSSSLEPPPLPSRQLSWKGSSVLDALADGLQWSPSSLGKACSVCKAWHAAMAPVINAWPSRVRPRVDAVLAAHESDARVDEARLKQRQALDLAVYINVVECLHLRKPPRGLDAILAVALHLVSSVSRLSNQ